MQIPSGGVPPAINYFTLPTTKLMDLICRGLRRISPDDTVALEHGRVLYDALYAQLASDIG